MHILAANRMIQNQSATNGRQAQHQGEAPAGKASRPGGRPRGHCGPDQRKAIEPHRHPRSRTEAHLQGQDPQGRRQGRRSPRRRHCAPRCKRLSPDSKQVRCQQQQPTHTTHTNSAKAKATFLAGVILSSPYRIIE